MRILLALALVVLVSSVAFSQAPPRNWHIQTLINGATFADSEIDTTGTYQCFAYPMVSVKVAATDSFSISKLYIDTRPRGTTAWTVFDSVATFTGVTTPAYNESILRFGSTNKLNYIDGQFRLRINFNSSNNAKVPASPTYSLYMLYGY